jgi:hypothetical protein
LVGPQNNSVIRRAEDKPDSATQPVNTEGSREGKGAGREVLPTRERNSFMTKTVVSWGHRLATLGSE